MPLDSGIMNICGSARYSTCNMLFGIFVGKKRKIIFFGHFSSFFEIFFFQDDVEIWGRSIHADWARSEQRNMEMGTIFFLKKIIFFVDFFNF